MTTRLGNGLNISPEGVVSNARGLEAGIDNLLSMLKKEGRNILLERTLSLAVLNRQVNTDFLPRLGENLCLQATDLVAVVSRSCGLLSDVFDLPDPAELLLVIEEQIQTCLNVLKAILKASEGASIEAEEMIFMRKQRLIDSRHFRLCNLLLQDDDAEKLRQEITLNNHASADLALAIFEDLPAVLDEVDPNTALERMLVRDYRDGVQKYVPEKIQRETRVKTIEEMGQERKERLEQIRACGEIKDLFWLASSKA